jgi:hypothetical protein
VPICLSNHHKIPELLIDPSNEIAPFFTPSELINLKSHIDACLEYYESIGVTDEKILFRNEIEEMKFMLKIGGLRCP